MSAGTAATSCPRYRGSPCTHNYLEDAWPVSDESWKSRALCRRFPDIEFVPDPFLGEDPMPAKQVCRLCPVTAACRVYREERDLVGVWGGEDEVDYLLRLDAAPPTTLGCTCSDNGVVIRTGMGTVCTTCGRVEE